MKSSGEFDFTDVSLRMNHPEFYNQTSCSVVSVAVGDAMMLHRRFGHAT